MANVTIALDDELARWARVEAAKQGKSLSRYLADVLQERRAPVRRVSPTLETFLSGPGYPGVSADLPQRDELYDRPALLRHEPAGLRPGSGGADEESAGG
jgi:hypothetical protein